MPLFLPNFDLQNYNTLGVPVTAQYYVSVADEEELLEALNYAASEKLPLLILGGGSNIVLCDDFPGLVIHIRLHGKTLVAENDEFIWLRVAAGENWHELVEYCLDFHYWGLENLSLIPGSVGAAPIQNIGAYGVELKDVFEELTAIEIRSGLSITFTKDSCEFGYRDSIFKGRLRDQYVITSVTFKLRKQPRLNLSYPALRDALAVHPVEAITPQLVSEIICDIRSSKLPDPARTPNVGSFFKNPVITTAHYERLREHYPELVAYPVDGQQVKLAAAWLIDKAGWRGQVCGPVAVHGQQALVLTNPGHAKGHEVVDLAKKIQASVWEKYQVALEPEPRFYP
ncbi:MAG: UDP-N-acetylmuramate dehydrogenase [Cellvibrio sp.]